MKDKQIIQQFFVSGQNGFTLLEVMIAVCIIAIGLVAVFGSQSRSLSQATEAHFNNVAPMLASLKLAELKSGKMELVSDEGEFEDEFSQYSWKLEINDATIDDIDSLQDLETPLQQVELTVAWVDTNFSYSVMLYERGQE